MEIWERDRLADVMEIVDAAMPGEALTEDDIVANLFDDPDPTLVVGDTGHAAVGSAVVRTNGSSRVAHVQLVAVAPHQQRLGFGRAVVERLQEWAFTEHDVSAVVAGAGAPFYLFAGVDVHATGALCLFEALGYQPRGAALNLAFPSRFRAPSPDGVEVRRVLSDADAELTRSLCAQHWPNWVPELSRGIEHAACHLAVAAADGVALGFGCHSVNRLGWLGPIGTDPARQHGGVGTALLSAIAKDVMAAGFDSVEVSWIGPTRFYAKAAGASVSRVFRTLVLPATRRA